MKLYKLTGELFESKVFFNKNSKQFSISLPKKDLKFLNTKKIKEIKLKVIEVKI